MESKLQTYAHQPAGGALSDPLTPQAPKATEPQPIAAASDATRFTFVHLDGTAWELPNAHALCAYASGYGGPVRIDWNNLTQNVMMTALRGGK